MVSAEGIRSLVEPALASAGLELWDVEIARDVVRIRVDRPGGVDLDSLTTVANRVVSPLLDQRPDLVPEGHYELEVSSPGVERPLRTLDQYRRYVGSEVAVKTVAAVEGARRHQGKLVAVDEAGIQLASSDPSPGRVIDIPFDQVDRARTVLVWGPTPPPRSRPKGGRPSAAGARSATNAKDSG